jgi:hypothetical protein
VSQGKDESSSAFFHRTRPSFVDWKPPTEAEKALEVKARWDAKEAELKRVTELAKRRETQRQASFRKR